MGTNKKKNRLAHKIVDRFTADPFAAAGTYDFSRVRLAHARAGKLIKKADRDRFMAAKEALVSQAIAAPVEALNAAGTPTQMKTLELKSMGVADLKAEAKARGLKGYSKLKKTELIGLLQGDA